jgi:hypothetical protein
MLGSDTALFTCVVAEEGEELTLPMIQLKKRGTE